MKNVDENTGEIKKFSFIAGAQIAAQKMELPMDVAIIIRVDSDFKMVDAPEKSRATSNKARAERYPEIGAGKMPAILVTDFTNGLEGNAGQLILPDILYSTFKNYEGHAVGKFYRIIKSQPAGKDYFTFDVLEMIPQ